MDALVILTSLALIFLLGLFCSWISERLKISNILLLILVGILIGRIPYKGHYLIELPQLFLTSVSILALVMIVFDSTSRFKLREFDSFSAGAIKLSLVSLILNMVILTAALQLILGVEHYYVALIFSVVAAGTDPAAVLVMFQDKCHRVIEMLKIESLINTPLIVIIPFVILELQQTLSPAAGMVTTLIEQVSPFVSKFVVGIGAGVVIGIIVFKLMRKGYDEHLSPLTLIAAALLTYVLAENLDGSGVLAVTTLGLFFGNMYVKGKRKLTEFSGTFSNALEILVFVMIGLIIKLPLTWGFFLNSLAVFGVYLAVRFLAINITFLGKFNLKEKLYMSLNGSKGIAVAVMAFILATFPLQGMELALDLLLTFLLYSIVLATVTVKLTNSFLEFKRVKSSK